MTLEILGWLAVFRIPDYRFVGFWVLCSVVGPQVLRLIFFEAPVIFSGQYWLHKLIVTMAFLAGAVIVIEAKQAWARSREQDPS